MPSPHYHDIRTISGGYIKKHIDEDCGELLQFVDEKVEWLHIDMAGPVWSDKKKAATGFAIPTLVEWVVSNSSS